MPHGWWGLSGAELLDVACPTTAFDYANRASAAPAYPVQVVTPAGRVSGGKGHLVAAEALWQAFVAQYGITPSHYRATQAPGPPGPSDQGTTASATAPSPNGTSSTSQNSDSDRGTTALRR